MDDNFTHLEEDQGIAEADTIAHMVDAHMQAQTLYAKMGHAFEHASAMFPPLDDLDNVEAAIAMISETLKEGCPCLCVLVNLASNMAFKLFVDSGCILVSDDLLAEMEAHADMDEEQTRAFFAQRFGVADPPDNDTEI